MRGDIRDWEKALESRVNWGWLNGCFGGTRISPSDLDFIVERNGHLLIGEIKPTRDAFSVGQSVTFQALARRPGVTAFCLAGPITEHELEPEWLLIMGVTGWKPVTRERFRRIVTCWFQWASSSNPDQWLLGRGRLVFDGLT